MLQKQQLNPHQRAIADGWERGETILVQALAGTGKTALIAYLASLLPAGTNTLATSYNRHTTAQLREKLPGAETLGLNGMGHRMLCSHFAIQKTNYVAKHKYATYLRKILPDYAVPEKDGRLWEDALLKLWDAVRLRLLDPANLTHLQTCANLHDVDLPLPITAASEILLALSEKGRRSADYWIDFTDQIWLPLVLNLPVRKKFHAAFLDEYQDLPRAMQELFFRVAGDAQVCVVGDPRQAIYQFAGADASATKRILAHFQSVVYTQPICYRCPTRHVTHAQQYAPELTAAEGAQEGVLSWSAARDIYKQSGPMAGDMIVCPRNKPLVEMYLRLVSEGVSCYIKGKGGGGLTDLVAKVATTKEVTFDNFPRHMDAYTQKRAAALTATGADERLIDEMTDRAETLRVLYVAADTAGVSTLPLWKKYIDAQFREDADGDVCLSTIHKAKGLEADRVYVLETAKRTTKRTSGATEAQNMDYIAATRGKQSLTYLTAVKTECVL